MTDQLTGTALSIQDGSDLHKKAIRRACYYDSVSPQQINPGKQVLCKRIINGIMPKEDLEAG